MVIYFYSNRVSKQSLNPKSQLFLFMCRAFKGSILKQDRERVAVAAGDTATFIVGDTARDSAGKRLSACFCLLLPLAVLCACVLLTAYSSHATCDDVSYLQLCIS